MIEDEQSKPPALRVSSLSKNYGAKIAVRDVSFDIQPGEVLGVLGPNGAGKSTIVRMIAGLLEPTRGSILFRGVPIRNQPETFRSALGYVPEQADVYRFLSGWEYLEMVCSLRGMSRRSFRRRGLDLFEAFQLADSRDDKMSGYSKGMRQRVALMSALIHNPAFLILDEPFSGLDTTSSLVVRQLVRILADRGRAVFFSSPSLEHLEQIASRILFLRQGSVITSGSSEEIRRLHGGATLTESFLALAESADPKQVALRIADITTTDSPSR